MDATLQELAETHEQHTAALAQVKDLGPKRNRLIVDAAKKHTKAEIAKALGLTSQRVIQILKKEADRNGTG